MKKRFIILLFILLFIILTFNSCFILAAVIHEAYHHSGDTFKIGENIYTVKSNYPFFNVVRLDVNGEMFIIQQNDSYRTTFYQYEFYITNLSWEDPYLTIDEYGRMQPGLFIKITYLEPVLSITRIAEKSNLGLNEITPITVKIKNTGSEIAQAVIFSETIPENVSLSGTNEVVNKINDKIYWNGVLYPGKEKSFSYSVKQTKYGSSVLKANVSYYYEGLQKVQPAPDITLTVPIPYEFTTNIISPIKINDISTFTSKLKNKEQGKTMKFMVEYKVSPEVKVLTTSNSLKQISPNTYQDSGYLEPENENNYEIRFTSSESGDYQIKSEGYCEVNNINFTLNNSKILFVINPTINSALFLNRQNIRSGETFIVRAELKNNDPKRSFVDLKFTLSSDFFSENIVLDSLNPGREYIIEKEFTTPELEELHTHTIILNGSYKTEGGETLKSETKKMLTTSPANQTVTLTQDIDHKILRPNENYTVEVKVRNEKDDPIISINTYDEFPSNIILLHGDTKKFIPGLVGKQEKTMYTYKAIIPGDFELNNFTITTRLNYTKAGIVYSKNIQTTIRVENLTLNIPKNTSQNQSQINQTTIINNEENSKSTGFFINLVNDIKSFFKSILGI
ncbi:MAG: hypothetical protein QXG00_04295 [Candidatus Woesearchaeota archaeon]